MQQQQQQQLGLHNMDHQLGQRVDADDAAICVEAQEASCWGRSMVQAAAAAARLCSRSQLSHINQS
jgi:hypothetical protein